MAKQGLMYLIVQESCISDNILTLPQMTQLIQRHIHGQKLRVNKVLKEYKAIQAHKDRRVNKEPQAQLDLKVNKVHKEFKEILDLKENKAHKAYRETPVHRVNKETQDRPDQKETVWILKIPEALINHRHGILQIIRIHLLPNLNNVP